MRANRCPQEALEMLGKGLRSERISMFFSGVRRLLKAKRHCFENWTNPRDDAKLENLEV